MIFDFSLETEPLATGGVVVSVAGEVDIFTAPDLRRAIVDAVNEGARGVIVDLTRTRFLDSTALGVLVGAIKRLRPLGGELVVVNTEPSTTRTFEITGLDQTLTIVETRDEAVAALDSVKSPDPAA